MSLSTSDGAKCACGAYHAEAGALSIKTLTLGEVRQVVKGGFRLVHGRHVKSLLWADDK
ncbi:MAG: hypothetical protein AB7P99_04665 [Vicinamibacterales bacterium]